MRLLAETGLRAGGPSVTAAEVMAVTGRSRRRAYELLRDARTEQRVSGHGCARYLPHLPDLRPPASASPMTRAASAAA